MFVYHARIRLHDTDAAGVLFYANLFKIIHDAYEGMIEQLGYSLQDILKKKIFSLPIVHAESDYKKPLYTGDFIEIRILLDRIGYSSISFSYRLLNPVGELVGTARTVHVSIDPETYTKIPLPSDLCEKLLFLFKEYKSE